MAASSAPTTDPGPRVLAIDIGGTKLAAGIGDADGTITRQVTVATNAAQGAAAVLRRALEIGRECYEAERAAGHAIAAVGVSTMGLTRETHVELAPNVPDWNEQRIPEALAAAFPRDRIAIANDVKVAAEAELTWGALRGVANGIYLNLGSGIAAGIIANGRLLEGAHGAAGEVGYTLLDDDGATARDGAAPFEEFYGGAGAARRLAQRGLAPSVAELVDRASVDPAAAAFLEDLWTGISQLTSNLCIALDPSVVAVGGGYVRGDSAIVEHIAERVARAVPYPPSVVAARFGADASLRGAAALALARARHAS